MLQQVRAGRGKPSRFVKSKKVIPLAAAPRIDAGRLTVLVRRADRSDPTGHLVIGLLADLSGRICWTLAEEFRLLLPNSVPTAFELAVHTRSHGVAE